MAPLYSQQSGFTRPFTPQAAPAKRPMARIPDGGLKFDELLKKEGAALRPCKKESSDTGVCCCPTVCNQKFVFLTPPFAAAAGIASAAGQPPISYLIVVPNVWLVYAEVIGPPDCCDGKVGWIQEFHEFCVLFELGYSSTGPGGVPRPFKPPICKGSQFGDSKSRIDTPDKKTCPFVKPPERYCCGVMGTDPCKTVYYHDAPQRIGDGTADLKAFPIRFACYIKGTSHLVYECSVTDPAVTNSSKKKLYRLGYFDFVVDVELRLNNNTPIPKDIKQITSSFTTVVRDSSKAEPFKRTDGSSCQAICTKDSKVKLDCACENGTVNEQMEKNRGNQPCDSCPPKK